MRQAAVDAGAVAECSGRLLNAEGVPVESGLDEQIIAVTIKQLQRTPKVIAVAQGKHGRKPCWLWPRRVLSPMLIIDAPLAQTLTDLIDEENSQYWLNGALGGDFTTDRSDASDTGYFSPVTNSYRADLLERFFGRVPRLPRVVASNEQAGTVQNGWGTSGTVFTSTASAMPDHTGAIAGFADAAGGHLPLPAMLASVLRVLNSLADAIDVLRQSGGKRDKILLIGGGSKSQALRRAAASIFNLPVEVALGAAKQAAWAAAGDLPDWKRSIEAAYEPKGDWGSGVRERYAEARKGFYGV